MRPAAVRQHSRVCACRSRSDSSCRCYLLLRLLVPAWQTIDWARYARWLANTLSIGIAAAVVALVVVLSLAYAARSTHARCARTTLVRGAVRLMSLGYAVPGAVIAVGILMPLAAFDNRLDQVMRSALGVGTGLLLTGSVVALLYGYLVRYFAVAYQTVEAGLARITPAMDASARSLGSTPSIRSSACICRCCGRQCWRRALLVFVDVMKELPATLVLRPFNFDTLAVIAYQMASDERLGQAALPALTIVAAGVIPVALLSRAISRASSSSRAVRSRLRALRSRKSYGLRLRCARASGGAGPRDERLVPDPPHLLRRPQLCRARQGNGVLGSRASVLLRQTGRCRDAGAVRVNRRDAVSARQR